MFCIMLLGDKQYISKTVGQNNVKNKLLVSQLIFYVSDMNRSQLLRPEETDYESSGYVETSLSEEQCYLTPDN